MLVAFYDPIHRQITLLDTSCPRRLGGGGGGAFWGHTFKSLRNKSAEKIVKKRPPTLAEGGMLINILKIYETHQPSMVSQPMSPNDNVVRCAMSPKSYY